MKQPNDASGKKIKKKTPPSTQSSTMSQREILEHLVGAESDLQDTTVAEVLASVSAVPIFQLDRQSMISMLNTLLHESEGLKTQMGEVESRLFSRRSLDELALRPQEMVKLYSAVAKRRNDGLTHILKICEMGMKSDIARTFLGLFKVDEELRDGSGFSNREAPEMTPKVRQLMHRIDVATNRKSGINDSSEISKNPESVEEE